MDVLAKGLHQVIIDNPYMFETNEKKENERIFDPAGYNPKFG
ncbi:hypothetical protein [Clostridioides difficile]|nr:hypothetical protein [Clostridioides difficile]MDL5067709.1 hypothetical protein [Clostridioides difficile]